MKSIKQYITESSAEYAYVIKIAKEVDPSVVSEIEAYLENYGLCYIGKLEKIIDDKFDFFDVAEKSVHCIKFITTTPLSSYIVQQQIRSILNIPEKYIVVRTATEPVELYAEYDAFKNEADRKAKEDGLQSGPLLSISRFYDDAEQPIVNNIFGDEYNKKFLNYLANIKNTRSSTEVDEPAPLFGWIAMNKIDNDDVEMVDFNAHIDTPKPVYDNGSENAPVDIEYLGQNGNFDDGAKQNIKLYIDPKTGKRSAIVAPRASLKIKR